MTRATIKFEKRKLERLKYSGKRKIYYAENFEGLCIEVNKHKKTYYAHFSIPEVDKAGKVNRVGKRKPLGAFHIPLEEIKAKLRKNLDDWKKQNHSLEDGLTVGGLASTFMKHGSGGYRVKVKGAKIKYNKKTHYIIIAIKPTLGDIKL